MSSLQLLSQQRDAAERMRIERLSGSDITNEPLSIKEIQKLPQFFGWIECSIDTSKFLMLLAGGDDGVALKYFWNGSYEPFTLKIWARYAARLSNKIAIDVGAHTGVYSLAALSLGAKNVVSIEPHFANYARLTMNLRASGYSPSNAFMLAAGNHSGTEIFSLPTDINYLSTGGKVDANAGGRKFPVRMTTIDKLVPEEAHSKVGLVKIDVEGNEHLVIEGASQILARSRPLVFFECLSVPSGEMVRKALSRYDYQFYMIDDKRMMLERDPFVSPRLLSNGNPDMLRLNRLAIPCEHSVSDLFDVII